MDGICNVLSGSTVRLELQGRAFTLSPMLLAEYAEREAYILSRRPRPVVCAELPKEKPLKRRVRQDESDVFQNSPHGLGWRLWRGLRKLQPEFQTVDDALAMIDRAAAAELTTIREKIELSEEADLLTEVYMPGTGSNDSDREGRIPWAGIVKNLSAKFGWLPEQIGRLTMYQALMYCGGKVIEEGRWQFEDENGLADYRNWQARRELAGLV